MLRCWLWLRLRLISVFFFSALHRFFVDVVIFSAFSVDSRIWFMPGEYCSSNLYKFESLDIPTFNKWLWLISFSEVSVIKPKHLLLTTVVRHNNNITKCSGIHSLYEFIDIRSYDIEAYVACRLDVLHILFLILGGDVIDRESTVYKCFRISSEVHISP